MAYKMFDMVKMTRNFHSKGYDKKYKLISKLIGLTKLTQNKKTDEDFLYDEGSKVKGYIAALKKAKIKTDNKFY